jgi:hypothetical protein
MNRNASEQRDDITAWFRSVPGLIFSSVVLGGAAIWLVVQFVVDLVNQGAVG